jgi:chromosome partitioning protein
MAAKIITVFNQKGGVGKTRVSMELAGTLGLTHKTMYVDLDTQATATKLASSASEERPFPATVSNLAAHQKPVVEIRKHIHDYDFIVIDCPPSVEATAPSAALLVSDLGIIPVGGDMGELLASYQAKTLGLNAQTLNPSLKLRFLANMTNRSVLMRDILTALESDEDVELMKTRIGTRTIFRDAAAIGQVVAQVVGPKNPARAEIAALVSEVFNVLEIR